MNKLLILNYHKLLHANDSVDSEESKFTIDKKQFIEQLDLIEALKIPIVSLQGNRIETSTSKHALALTFDDGNSSDFDIVYPILKKRKIPATFFLVTSTIGTENHLSWNQISELVNNNFQIGSHSVSHNDMSGLSQEEIKLELQASKKRLETKTGIPIERFALPYGKLTSEIERMAKDLGYKNILTTNGGFSNSTDFCLHRWNIKSSTSIEEFERILTRDKLVHFVKKGKSVLKGLMDNRHKK